MSTAEDCKYRNIEPENKRENERKRAIKKEEWEISGKGQSNDKKGGGEEEILDSHSQRKSVRSVEDWPNLERSELTD